MLIDKKDVPPIVIKKVQNDKQSDYSSFVKSEEKILFTDYNDMNIKREK